jgi:hypothetical protein
MGFSIIALFSLVAIAQTTGAPPSVTLSPSSIDFKDQVVGKASRPQRITLTNTGGKPLYVNSVTIVDGESSDFGLSGDTCTGSTIGPGKSCVIDVSFTPSATGSRKSTLTITDNAVDSPQRVPLYGSGINSAAVPPSGKPSF